MPFHATPTAQGSHRVAPGVLDASDYDIIAKVLAGDHWDPSSPDFLSFSSCDHELHEYLQKLHSADHCAMPLFDVVRTPA